jgi:hypothetical protein
MAATIPTIEPYEVTAGDTWKWDKSLADYKPSDTWALTYSFRAKTGTGFNVTASANSANDGWNIVVAKSATVGYTAAEYDWQAYVTKSAERFMVDEGKLIVSVDLNAAATGSTTDLRSHSKRMVDAIQAVLEGRVDSDVENYSIGGRSITKIAVSELVSILATYEEKLEEEQKKRRLDNKHGSGRVIKARFNSLA